MKNEKELPSEVKPLNESSKYVELHYNGVGVWTLDFREGGTFEVYPNKKITLDLTDKVQLHILLSVLREINSQFNKLERVIKDPYGNRNHERYDKWSIVKGMENIPENMRKIHYDRNKQIPKPIELEIISLCPTYFDKDKKGGLNAV